MRSVLTIVLVINRCFILQVVAWHALIDATDSDPIATTPLGSTNFVVYRKKIPWNEARTACEKTIGRLAVLPKLDDAVELVNQIKSISTPFSEEYDHAVSKYEFGMDRRYWIGLTDLAQEGEWIWMDSGVKLDYDYWYPSQPDHLISGQLEHCVVLWNPGYHFGDSHTLNDEDCLHKHYFVCEKVARTLQAPPPAAPVIASPATSPAVSPAASPAVSPAASPAVSPAASPAASPAISPAASPATSPAVSPATSPAASPATPVAAPSNAPPPGHSAPTAP